MKKQIVSIFLLALASLPLFAGDKIQSEESVHNAIRAFAAPHIQHLDPADTEIKIGRLNSQIKLNKCQEPLDIKSISKINPMGRNNLSVECHAPNYWKIHLSFSVKVFEDVVITSSPLARGAIITSDNITTVRKEVNSITQGFFSDINEVVGYQLKKPVRAGAVINKYFLKLPHIITKGQQVTIRSANKRISVVTTGTALKDGAKGDIINIRNSRSGRVIQGKVVNSNTVEINL